MKINQLRKSIFFMFFFATGLMVSQEIGSETVVVVKPYSPSVNDASKIKENPAITDSISLQKKTVQYSIFSVPVASTFSPAKGRATNVERERPPKVYDNYITLGFGSYTSALAELYSNIEVNRTDNFGIFLTHNSAQGDIEGVELEDNFYDTDLNLNYSSRNRDLIWNVDFGAEHQLYNWYGVEPERQEELAEIDPQHNYLSVYAGGEITFDDFFFDGARARYRYFQDDYESVEHRFTLKPTFELTLGGELFKTDLILDYVGGSYENISGTEKSNYGFINTGLQSGLVILRDDLTLNLGAAIYYSLDSENSDSGIYVYPRVTASYKLGGEAVIAYAGLEGDLKQNSYYSFVQTNPFLAPSPNIKPTDQQYDLYAGLKGKLSDNVGYNVRASYLAEDFKPLYLKLPVADPATAPAYGHENSFEVIYDQVKTVSAFGELNFDVRRNFNLRLNAEYFVYNTDTAGEPWNLPQYKANVLADYQITQKWFAGANLFMVGERKDRDYANEISIVDPLAFSVVELDPYVDLNLNAGYRFNDRLSIFAKANNVFGENYEKWHNYPVMGLQLMAGATYKFDFGR